MNDDTIVRIPWGMWHMHPHFIYWTANPHIAISADEQYFQNVANGFNCEFRRLPPVVTFTCD